MSFNIPKALPSLPQCKFHPLSTPFNSKQSHVYKPHKSFKLVIVNQKKRDHVFALSKPNLIIQVGALLTTVVSEPAFAVTGVNNEEDIVWVLIQLAIFAFFYLLVSPPFIMNWLRIRWYKRNLLEMYVQFMIVFMFFPGILLWAPFLNFRKFPRDPDMKYPWSVPEDPSKIRNSYRKFPWATLDDYEV
ncbi:NAD(P)H-quinone oxidoreductase subunit L, chloroplastic [Cynara cardunculus var. scolymus]|uniref:NAD(P)H-quinone oxidoreductase subunit L n=1 Tax=Cynara cardunculus var. scolymus TaxID=59895 RepID=A0A103YAD5_CYNCS|nr:NAD(P)H-quinone oxidoreductase subunit L, chloroplastic [Cynara cardunculus var. scolymus]KVI05453.1 NAD(P)H-quinone oxidoreductase subunit L [Cynara cardunculus var. scolymus]